MKFIAAGIKSGILLFFFIAASAAVKLAAQEKPPVINVNKIILYDTINYRCFYFADSLHNTSPAQLPHIPFKTRLPKSVLKQLTTKEVEKTWYVQFRLQNSADTGIIVHFYPGVYLNRIDLYACNDSTGEINRQPVQLPGIQDSIGFRAIQLAPRTTTTWYARLKFVNTNINGIDLRIIRGYYLSSFTKINKLSPNNANIFTYIITGMMLMMIFYSMAVFILNRSIEFMYYSFFAFFMGALFFLKSFNLKAFTSFNYYFESYLDFILQSLGVFFYFIFLRKFLETKKNFRFLHKLFIAGQAIIIASIVLFSFFNFFTDNYSAQEMVEQITKYQWFATTAVFIVYAIVHNNKMLNYLAVGHFFLMVTSISSQLIIQYPALIRNIKSPSVWRDALFYYELGVTIELIFFLMALAFKNRRDIVERTRERERLRLDNERKEFEKQLAIVEAKQEERNRISTDMHDELGSGVTAIRLMSEIVKTKMKDNTLPEIDKISSNANDLLSKMNTIIWTMSSSNDKLDNMIAYIRSYAFEFFESTSITCHFESAEHIPSTEMSGEKRRNIFLCVKESLNNVAKHAKANDVWIKVTVLFGKLEIEIHDNGVGINLQKLREFGNGLTNMKKRIISIDGSFAIINKEGTTTTLTVPL